MKTCAFVGHAYVFEDDIKNKISEAIKEILLTDNEFIFYYISGYEFDDICCCTITEMQVLFSEKSIRLVGIISEKEDELSTKDNSCEYIYPLESYTKNSFANHKLAVKWMMEQSDILLFYYYNAFIGLEYYYIEYAEQNPNLQIINLMYQKTEEILQEIAEKFTDKMRYICKMHNEGKTYTELASILKIKAGGIGYTYRHSHRKLRNGFRKHMEKVNLAQIEKERIKTCSILFMKQWCKDLSQKKSEDFASKLEELICHENVGVFILHQREMPSEIQKMMFKLKEKHSCVKLHLYVPFYCEKCNDRYLNSEVYPQPFDEVIGVQTSCKTSITQMKETYRKMVDKSEFVICDMKQENSNKYLFHHIHKTERIRNRHQIKIIDVSEKLKV